MSTITSFICFIARVKSLILRRRKHIWGIPAVLLLAYSNCGAEFIVSRCWKKSQRHNNFVPQHSVSRPHLQSNLITHYSFCSDTRKNESSSSTDFLLCYCAAVCIPVSDTQRSCPPPAPPTATNIHSLTSFSYFTLYRRLLSSWNKLRPNKPADWSVLLTSEHNAVHVGVKSVAIAKKQKWKINMNMRKLQKIFTLQENSY